MNDTRNDASPTLSREQSLFLTEFQTIEADFVALCNKVGKSRELSLAITNMQQAAFWARSHVAPRGQ